MHIPKSMRLSPMNAHPSSLHAAALEAHGRLVLSRRRLWAESTVLLEDKPARGGCSLLHSSTLVHTSSSADAVHCFPVAQERGQGMLPHSSAENQLKGIECNAPWAGSSALSATELSSFHLAVPQEETQAELLLSGFWLLRKPLVLCLPESCWWDSTYSPQPPCKKSPFWGVLV